jgi:hypothetical protein
MTKAEPHQTLVTSGGCTFRLQCSYSRAQEVLRIPSQSLPTAGLEVLRLFCIFVSN